MQVICIYVKQIIRGEAGGNKLKCNWRQKYVIRTIDVRNSDKDGALAEMEKRGELSIRYRRS